ncbi:MAG: hypothetical protein PVG07_02620 [Acidobacteriota bacterium]|jgi:hypothetical protein
MQKRIQKIAGFLLIAMAVLGTSPASVLAATDPTSQSEPSTRSHFERRAQRSSDVIRVQRRDGSFVEKLKGEAALTHLYNLFSRRPEAFKGVRKSLRARGLEPTEHVYVERTVRLASNRNESSGSRAVPTQDYSEENSDGEIVFWSWDDGNDATWEGSIYVEVYSSGDASTWEGQIDASDETHEWNYYEKTWSGGGDGPGGEPLPATNEAPPWPSRRSHHGVTLASRSPNGSHTAYGSNGSMYTPVGWSSWAHCWRACVVGGCAAVAIQCIRSGPLWPACFGIGCIGAEVGCAITCWLLE